MVPDLPTYCPPQKPRLSILYQDDDLIFLDKPSGLLTVAGKSAGMHDCLEHRVQEIYPQSTIVHRLDMETSGVIIMARHKDAHKEISRQFEHRETQKIYEAMVWGRVQPDEGYINEPLICDWPNRPMQKVCYENGKKASTGFRVIERCDLMTRVALYPVTGRSHQLRVHMKYIGHAITGDRLYAEGDALKASPRLCLHAKSLTITHPEKKERLTITAPLPF